MTDFQWQKMFIWVLKANAVIWVINAVLFGVFGLAGYGWNGLVAAGFFSKVTLLETGVSFIIGGALAFSGSALPSKTKEYVLGTDEKWSMEKLKASEKRANKFLILAAFLLVECIIIGLLGA